MAFGLATAATDGAIGFDTAVPLTQSQVVDYVSKGYQFCVRYVSRTDGTRQFNAGHGTADLSAAETDMILSHGLALMVVQHVATSGWVPTAPLGQQYGSNAAAYCLDAEVRPGVNVWLDLEDIPIGTPHEDIVGYCNAWFSEVANAGYVPGVYVGFNVWLSSDELFFDLNTKHYWRAAGNIPDVAHRGYQLFQHTLYPGTAHEFDKNVARTDGLSGNAIWLQKAAQV